MTWPVEYLGGKVAVYCGDCLDVLTTLAPVSIGSIVTDPPYELKFMGKGWDGTGVAFKRELWAEVLRVLKPGGHLLAFSGSRTYHRMVCAIEDAGFEIRDQIQWIYGSGFPKSLDVSKAIDKAAGYKRGTVPDTRNGPNTNQASKGDKFGGGYLNQVRLDEGAITSAARQWQGFGTSLKPAHEPLVLARKPLAEPTVAANVLRHGTGAINVDGCRVPHAGNGSWGNGRSAGSCWSPGRTNGGSEPEGKRHDNGRFPANLIHDGSDEVEEAFAEFGSSKSTAGLRGEMVDIRGNKYSSAERKLVGSNGVRGHSDSGSASRFFYTAKADAEDRIGSSHPTVKPLDLIQYLVRLVTPPGGLVLDPFAGTGTTAEAAFREGMRAILIEREPEYQADIARRMELVLAGPDQKRHAIIKASGKVEDPGPLFGEAI
jgi:DNA modification methylase